MVKLIYPKIILALSAALVAALAGLWWSVTSHADTRAELAAALEYIKTTKEVRDALDNLPSDDDAVLDWLRDFSGR